MSTSRNLETDLVACLARTIGQSDATIDLEQSLEDTGIDSLSLLRLRMLLEETFDVTLPDDLEIDTTTGVDLLALLRRELEPSS